MGWLRETPAGKWKGCYRDPSGQTRSRTFGKNEKTKAQKWANDQESAIRGGRYVDPKAGDITLQQLYDEVHADRDYAPGTLGVHRSVWGTDDDRDHPLHALRYRKARTVTREDIDSALKKVTRPEMREKTRLLLSTLFNHAITVHGLTLNPAKKAIRASTRAERMGQKPKNDGQTHRYLNDEELARLVAEVPARYAMLARLQARAGLRPGEALALRVGKFDPMRRKLVIDTSTTGFTKTGEARTLTLPAKIAEELAEHLARFSDPADPNALVFPKDDQTILTTNGWRLTFMRATKRAGISRGLTPNDLRHTAVSWAISLGANVYDVQKMVGHAKPSITLDVYGELWDEGHERLAERMDTALRAEIDTALPGATVYALEG